ncbi:MAG: ribokinase [Clostridia bacterium]|nr:ribokinase [Clostridia bacterium]
MAVIIGPGSLNADITCFAPRLPRMGETVQGSLIRMGAGGKGNNQFTAAARLGAEAYIIGCVGDDAQGDVLMSHVRREGIRTDYLDVITASHSGSAFIEVQESDAQNRIIVCEGANACVDGARVRTAEKGFAATDAVLAQLETTTEAVLAAKRLAQAYGKPFILNPAPCVPLPDEMFTGTDYITPNETEAEALTGISVRTDADCRAAAEKLLYMGVKRVIITLGERGVYYYDGTREIRVPALSVECRDTTGAGDAFNGALATAIAEGRDIHYALRFATCVSALCVTREGAADSMPYRDEALALMKEAFGL